jgi:Mlc titration factor MtfA (ptsG expression regulator)
LFKTWRRRRVLARRTIPDDVWNDVVASTPALERLAPQTLERLRALALLFLHEKRVEAAADLTLDDRMRVLIAALACVPILELGLDCYSAFYAVIVYPDEFVVPDREVVDEDGVVHVGDEVMSGEAWEQGPVVLSWPDVEASGQAEGFDVVAHEFSHKLDMLDGAADGLPPLHADMSAREWRAAFESEYRKLRAALERNEDPWLDPYAAEDPSEFFAVCCEMFFDVPADFRREHPALYAQLARYFKQDPAAATPRGA